MQGMKVPSYYDPTRPMPAFYLSDEWITLRGAILARDKNICRYCDEPAETVDHVLPRCAGGPNEASNLVAACHLCNANAGSRIFEDFESKRNWLLALYEERREANRPPEVEEDVVSDDEIILQAQLIIARRREHEQRTKAQLAQVLSPSLVSLLYAE